MLVIVNSGNANCATGRPGIQACQRVCGELGKICSNVPCHASYFHPPRASSAFAFRSIKSLPRLADLTPALRKPTEQGVTTFAQAIMTTDTSAEVGGGDFSFSWEDWLT